MPRWLAVLSIATPLALAACHTESGPRHVEPNAFAWSGAVAPESWVHIRNMSGHISVVAADSPTVEVHASKSWRGRRDGSSVQFIQRETDDGVIICTIYGEHNSCTPDGYGSNGSTKSFNPFDLLRGSGHVEVDYVVRVPAGVKVDVSTISGELGVADVTSEVKAETVNGKVRVATRNGPVTASSVNGSVMVAIDSLTTPGNIDISTVNGSVTAQLPAALQGNVSLETVNGSATTDYSVTGNNSSSPKHLSGTIGTGGGGRMVKLETVNGSVKLLKGT
ncbi:MAG TPA: DUF4097 family beta strand repeat-containing protein [Gemmatimonadaceae bacterium]|jgi:Uncharacterized conserved protein